jgi:hypothetical protein
MARCVADAVDDAAWPDASSSSECVMINVLPLAALTLDEELQPRAAIDRTVLENYVQLLVDGVRFPPIVAFRDTEAKALWLADGFHRWHAHKVLDADGIDVEIIDGSRRDALLYSLSANAKHGLQRGDTDYRRAYEIACRNRLVDPTDSEAVAALLRCSGSWAEKLTARARVEARAWRDGEIVRLKGEGLSIREIADKTGHSHGTVQRAGVPKADSADLVQDDPPAWVQKLQELNTPASNNWHSALQALRVLNEQVSVDELFANRFSRFDHAVGPELDKAFAWISELHRRFVDERDQRRRA